MRRLMVALAAVGVLVVSSMGAAFAQTPTPPTNQYGWGHMGWAAFTFGCHTLSTTKGK